MGRVRTSPGPRICTRWIPALRSQVCWPGLALRATWGATRTWRGRSAFWCVDPRAAGGLGPWRWVKPGSKSTQGCGWLPPVAQYQGEAGEDIHFFLSKHPPIASIPIDCEKPAAPLKGEGRLPRAPLSVSPDPSAGISSAGAQQRWTNASSQVRLAASGTAATSCGSTPACPPAGPFLLAFPVTSSDLSPVLQRPRHPGSRPGPELEKLFREADVWQPSLQQTTGLGFLDPFPTPAQPGLPEPAVGARQSEESPANAHPRPPAHPSAIGEKAPKQTRSAEQFPVLACKGPGLLGIGLPPGCSEKYS